jgi:GNAT superfamily N-acetyltransferase
VQLELVTYDHPDATVLIAAVQDHYRDVYGDIDHTPVVPAEFAPPNGRFFVGYDDETRMPIACGGWRTVGRDAEIKRMYVHPRARRRGLASQVLAELERSARAAGLERMILETGDKQPAAQAMYRVAGYTRIPAYGFYRDGNHFGKPLSTASRADSAAVAG